MATTTPAPAMFAEGNVVFAEGQYEFLEDLACWLVSEVDVLKMSVEGAREEWIDANGAPKPISLHEFGRLGLFAARIKDSLGTISCDLAEVLDAAREVVEYGAEGEPFADGRASRELFVERLEALAARQRTAAREMAEAAERERPVETRG